MERTGRLLNSPARTQSRRWPPWRQSRTRKERIPLGAAPTIPICAWDDPSEASAKYAQHSGCTSGCRLAGDSTHAAHSREATSAAASESAIRRSCRRAVVLRIRAASARSGPHAGPGYGIPSRDEGDKLFREMCCAREASAGGDPRARARFERLRNRVCTGHLRFALVLSKRYLRRRGRLDLEDYSRIIRAPVHVQDARGRCNRAAATAVAATGRAPGVEDLATITGLSPAIVARAVAQTGDVSSLDVAVFEGRGETVVDTVAGADPSPLDAVPAARALGSRPGRPQVSGYTERSR
jgi:hypothetical protein